MFSNTARLGGGLYLTWTPTITAPGSIWMETFIVTVGTGYNGILTNVLQVTTIEGATEVAAATTCTVGGWAQMVSL